MALAFGSSLASKVYLGATEINLAYFGATQVYSSATFSAEAQNYFDRLDTAGDTTYTPYKQPLANYIDGLVTLGGAYWNTMLSATSFVGVGIQGIVVPLRSGMTVPTQNNFVTADLNQLTGLKGNASTKYISTGVNTSTLGINNHSLSVYLTADREAGAKRYISGANAKLTLLGNVTGFKTRSASATLYALGSSTAVGELVGISRDNSSDFDWSYETSGTQLNTSTDSGSNVDIKVFAGEGGNNATAARLATYHIGPALNLATLEGLQDTLMSEIRTAHTFVAVADYFSRLDTAGDTTYLTYKQPLTNYISSLVELGGAYWDNLESAASFVGVGIEGVTVPLKSTMPTLTNNNFVAGDLNVLTGLKGDGSTKYIDTGTKFNDCPQNDFSMSVNVTETLLESNSGNYLAYQSFVDGVSQIASSNDSGVSNNDLVIRCQTRNANIISNQGSVEDFTGVSRELSTEYLVQYGASSTTITRASQAPANQIISLFGSPAVSKTNARFATFHIGRSLDMPTLRGLQNTLISEIAAI